MMVVKQLINISLTNRFYDTCRSFWAEKMKTAKIRNLGKCYIVTTNMGKNRSHAFLYNPRSLDWLVKRQIFTLNYNSKFIVL